jgi:hypothetical protein
MLRISSLVECVSVLHRNRCLQSIDFFFLRQYVQPCLLKNPKYTFYTIKSSLKLAYYPKTCNFTISSTFSNSGHVDWCTASTDTILKLDTGDDSDQVWFQLFWWFQCRRFLKKFKTYDGWRRMPSDGNSSHGPLGHVS